MDSLRGNFLVAAPYGLDPNFMETVVLIVEHSGKGGFGVILNRPAERKHSFTRELRNKSLSHEKAELYCGGPVTGPYLAVHMLDSYAEREVLPGVFFSGQEENVFAIVRRKARPYKIFVGYSGWGAGQLEYEIEKGAWRVVRSSAEGVFANSAGLWTDLSRQFCERQLRDLFHIKHFPAHPMLN
jgi:putative transcriptional regulator